MNIEEMQADWERRQNEESWEAVAARLESAIAEVAARDIVLLEDGYSERAVAHRLAVYLEQEFAGWDVDCEFNRQGETAARESKQVPATAELPASYPKRGGTTAYIDPDIVIDKRRIGQNLLVIEVKPADRKRKKLNRVRAKLKACLTAPRLRYKFAVLVKYRVGPGAHFEAVEAIAP